MSKRNLQIQGVKSCPLSTSTHLLLLMNFFILFDDPSHSPSHAGSIPWGHPESAVLNHSCMLESPGDKAEQHYPRTVILELHHANKSLVKRQNLIRWVWSGAGHSAFLISSWGILMLLDSTWYFEREAPATR